QFYKHYGDASVLAECYPNMMRYFDYLEAHSENDLILSDKEGEWCLGDWCPPISVVLPAPFVNNYFYIKSLYRCMEIAKLIGKEEDIPLFEERIALRKCAIMASYYNKWDGNFLGGQQGANAFAVDIGLGDERTYPNMVAYYDKLGRYDTGIFGTDLVTRILFERGDGDVAVKLLTSTHTHSYGEMRRRGATTIWEYWPESLRDRSRNHPMFGAVVAYFYEYLLGIRQTKDSAGYRELEIAPAIVPGLCRVEGHQTLPAGRVAVAYESTDRGVAISVEIPQGQAACLVYGGQRYALTAGKNTFQF
ncbi:MAG: hypothetical protein IJX62_05150, partial [Clostridia bacterium]|nr:hypothetical protein [Clostridia bacterium]